VVFSGCWPGSVVELLVILWGPDLSAVGQGESKRRVVVRVSAFRSYASVSERLVSGVFQQKCGDCYMCLYVFLLYVSCGVSATGYGGVSAGRLWGSVVFQRGLIP
jgi:hypothetical protein